MHGREVRVGDDHLMAERFEVAGTPLTFSWGFDENVRLQLVGEQFVKALPVSLDPVLNQLAVFSQNADLAGSHVEVDTDVIHS